MTVPTQGPISLTILTHKSNTTEMLKACSHSVLTIQHLQKFHCHNITTALAWVSYQIRKIAGCACAGNAGNVFPRRRFQRKPLVSDPGMHHGTCVTHVPWCMSGSLTCGDGENVPGIPGACATCNFTYLARGPCAKFCSGNVTMISMKAQWNFHYIWFMNEENH